MDDPETAMMRALYDEHAAALWRYALRLTGDRARAEDVVQETLLRAWRHRPDGLHASAQSQPDGLRASAHPQPDGLRASAHPADAAPGYDRSPRAWLFTVARNMIIDERRSARFRNETGVADPEQVADHAGTSGVPDQVDTALDRILLSTALGELSAEHRAVVRRAYYQGWSTGQIAEDLQIPEGTVKSRLHYAVRALRLNLQEMGVTR
ncbi:sigma-70 family RNA polymerase sigma factor [Mycobacterium sp. TNTM28]|uniref:Sigma-70 family RNA polymerase sigma factor n=1 Tax=[Mycobacterium] fortunisiensis TaxID=2600579 RepID=A0ABS6KJG7_9MYCO|nr:sigma-70 family RNA polymerase sigma factor [[Mycobacterium] fortunisiensis]MBU9763725.1 sigma-70 family RNA polymerase sigma factor [[Mycobacterium] fortunisiensis]